MLDLTSRLDSCCELLAPDVCSACDGPADGLPGWCGECLAHLPWCAQGRCAVCGGALVAGRCPACFRAPWAVARALLRYEDPVVGLVGRWKFRPDPSLSRGLGAVFRAGVGRWSRGRGRPLVVPVPQSTAAWIQRGFSPAVDLAAALAGPARGGVAHALRRGRRAGPQVGLTARERSRNVRGLFRVPARMRRRLRGRRVVLVDDVITTGATARECARHLGEAGAAEVVVAALARADRP